MSIIDEIKAARKEQLTDEQKGKILTFVSKSLTRDYKAIIYGAPHFGKWEFREDIMRCEAPYALHPAIEEWLKGMGFHCSRYYNKMGVEQGLEVRL